MQPTRHARCRAGAMARMKGRGWRGETFEVPITRAPFRGAPLRPHAKLRPDDYSHAPAHQRLLFIARDILKIYPPMLSATLVATASAALSPLLQHAVTKTESGWTLLVKQDSRQQDYFNRAEMEDGEYNVDAPEGLLYSHLNVDYSQFKSPGTNGKMTLQLRWADLETKTLTWKQSSSPMATSVTGFEIKDNQIHHYNGVLRSDGNWDDFKGMAKSSNKWQTLLDGQTTHRNWYYAVGTSSGYKGSIPGPRGTGDAAHNTDNMWVHRVELWVKNVADARHCADWTCTEWCENFSADDEAAGLYTANGCDADGDMCSC